MLAIALNSYVHKHCFESSIIELGIGAVPCGHKVSLISKINRRTPLLVIRAVGLYPVPRSCPGAVWRYF